MTVQLYELNCRWCDLPYARIDLQAGKLLIKCKYGDGFDQAAYARFLIDDLQIGCGDYQLNHNGYTVATVTGNHVVVGSVHRGRHHVNEIAVDDLKSLLLCHQINRQVRELADLGPATLKQLLGACERQRESPLNNLMSLVVQAALSD